MAKREPIKMDVYETWGLNVSETVGIGGANKTGVEAGDPFLPCVTLSPSPQSGATSSPPSSHY